MNNRLNWYMIMHKWSGIYNNGNHPIIAAKRKIKFKNNENNLRNLWGNIKHTNIHIIRILEGEEERGIKNIFDEIMAENIPNLKKETDTQAQKTQTVSNMMIPNRPTPRHIN